MGISGTTADTSEMRRALNGVRGDLAGAAGFSLGVNLLMLVPVLYMLQLYDRVVPTSCSRRSPYSCSA